MDAPLPFVDPKAQAGKFAAPAETFDVLVVGGGPAGTAAAVEAAGHGASVLLIDEHPVGAGLVGLDVPFLFGGRATAAVVTPERLVEQVVATSPGLEAAFEAGVDVRLGVSCFGLYVEGPGSLSLPGRIAALSDGERSWTVGFRTAVVATGARDLVIFFPGSELPGVVGAVGLHTLLARYDAFDGRRVVVLGSDALAVEAVLACRARGVAVAAVVEVALAVAAPADLAAALADTGVPVLTSHVVVRAEGDPTGIRAAVVAPVGGGEATRIACDTICLALGRVPVVDLLDAAGAALAYRDDAGGFVPTTADGLETTLPCVFVAGDCAGLGRRSSDGTADAAGRAAARAALARLGRDVPAAELPVVDAAPTEAYRLAWMDAMTAAGGPDVEICRCEEVTRAELLGVRPPRYLGADAAPCPPLERLAEDGTPSPDQLKRLTRAGMGVCQGRRCREQVAMATALATGTPLARLPLAGYRAPVRPLPLAAIADRDETPAMTADWDVWFGIPTQWVPYDDIGTEREDAFLGRNMHL
ncbi:NAD(P)/FAD-dependent oxidoreductase [Oharaeibacter diazotrophicus]|uniref:Pyruvate/2-oxoglutarate dehydrogenase complex dihydrolipoamide dehydrogenase (E3) component n=3 Tax=Oharaeibacter diazotrophicus TaxID=1920512 RepID=A0A4V3CWN4_9HYPH|nr:NAD(P)/FAD-dependent oxidoreductase [Oharaeibacter diazotrophicus]TDP87078.1 pyruvate/2-oxoglutarate dehydrogenase complex dihydrolipoamide dehydrogenase (E3) component [Oharaeibacter diazotrophicus]BBE70979.1 hydrogen cyanide synthase subunit HcnB [Pleomorphomonas sp. SM30]GLS77729.1 hypothetical protein GCM10007904_30660 [Oharaeibacter diazotrophicus]